MVINIPTVNYGAPMDLANFNPVKDYISNPL